MQEPSHPYTTTGAPPPGVSPGSSQDPPADDVRSRAERVVAEGEDIRNRIRVIVEDAARAGRAGAEQLNGIARDVIAGAVDGLKNVSPERRDQALREAVDGLGDGVQRTADATRAVIEGAARRGERFAKEDLDRFRHDLQTLGDRFVETVSRATGRAAEEFREELRDIRGHAEEVLRSIRPALRSAAEATTRTGSQAASSAASGAAHTGRAALGALFGAVGSLLSTAGETIAGRGERPGSNPGRGPAGGERPGSVPGPDVASAPNVRPGEGI